MARIYDQLPLKFLDVLSTFEPTAREGIIKSMALGMMNIKLPNRNNSSVQDLQVLFPSSKYVYKEDYSHRLLVDQIYKAVAALLKSKS